MNKLVLTLVALDNVSMKRMHEMGDLITQSVRDQLKVLIKDKKLETGELMMGSPGFGVVLSLGVERRAQHQAPIRGKRGPKPKAKPVPEI